MGTQANDKRNAGTSEWPYHMITVVQKAMSMDAIENNNATTPVLNIEGKERWNAYLLNRDVRIDKNIRIEVEQESIPMTSDTEKTRNHPFFNK